MSFRFWQYVDLRGDDECWPWMASRHPDGYGQFVVGTGPVGAHRIAYALVYGQPPRGARVTHRCSNRACVNPAHLALAGVPPQREPAAQAASRPIELSDNDVKRFWSKVNVSSPQDCWLWTASARTGGYGSFWLAGMNVGAHRVAYTLAYGSIPNGLCICHRCDTPRCVNPAHLFAGTQEVNQADKVAKQRHSHGESHGAARLTFDDAAEIRRLAAQGTKRTVLATRFKVSRAVVHAVLTNRIWKHVASSSHANVERRERLQEHS